MAFLHRHPSFCVFFLTIASLVLLASPAHSLNCSSQKFTNNKLNATDGLITPTNCIDLPTLDASLHWNYDSKTSSLSIAFVAPPAKPDGWIAWAINPTQTGMVGSQALVALKDSNGSMIVKTYNLSSYSSIVEGKIAFEVSESSAEFSGRSMRIFATVKLPEKMTEVNHVWQIGGSVIEGMPKKHEFQPGNLKSMGKLQLQSSEKGNGTTVGSPNIVPSPSPSSSPSAGSSTAISMYVVCMLMIGALILN